MFDSFLIASSLFKKHHRIHSLTSTIDKFLSIPSINIFYEEEKTHHELFREGFYQHKCSVLLATTVSEWNGSKQFTFFVCWLFANLAFGTQYLLVFVHWFWKEHFEFSMNFNLCCFYSVFSGVVDVMLRLSFRFPWMHFGRIFLSQICAIEIYLNKCPMMRRAREPPNLMDKNKCNE